MNHLDQLPLSLTKASCTCRTGPADNSSSSFVAVPLLFFIGLLLGFFSFTMNKSLSLQRNMVILVTALSWVTKIRKKSNLWPGCQRPASSRRAHLLNSHSNFSDSHSRDCSWRSGSNKTSFCCCVRSHGWSRWRQQGQSREWRVSYYSAECLKGEESWQFPQALPMNLFPWT